MISDLIREIKKDKNINVVDLQLAGVTWNDMRAFCRKYGIINLLISSNMRPQFVMTRGIVTSFDLFNLPPDKNLGGWISPDGDFEAIEPGSPTDVAYEIIQGYGWELDIHRKDWISKVWQEPLLCNMNLSRYWSCEYPECFLLYMGWVLIHHPYESIDAVASHLYPLTEAQQAYLDEHEFETLTSSV